MMSGWSRARAEIRRPPRVSSARPSLPSFLNTGVTFVGGPSSRTIGSIRWPPNSNICPPEKRASSSPLRGSDQRGYRGADEVYLAQPTAPGRFQRRVDPRMMPPHVAHLQQQVLPPRQFHLRAQPGQIVRGRLLHVRMFAGCERRPRIGGMFGHARIHHDRLDRAIFQQLVPRQQPDAGLLIARAMRGVRLANTHQLEGRDSAAPPGPCPVRADGWPPEMRCGCAPAPPAETPEQPK